MTAGLQAQLLSAYRSLAPAAMLPTSQGWLDAALQAGSYSVTEPSSFRFTMSAQCAEEVSKPSLSLTIATVPLVASSEVMLSALGTYCLILNQSCLAS